MRATCRQADATPCGLTETISNLACILNEVNSYLAGAPAKSPPWDDVGAIAPWSDLEHNKTVKTRIWSLLLGKTT